MAADYLAFSISQLRRQKALELTSGLSDNASETQVLRVPLGAVRIEGSYIEDMAGRRRDLVQDKGAARGRAKRLRAKKFLQVAHRPTGRGTGRETQGVTHAH